jgi:hypothetical protein
VYLCVNSSVCGELGSFVYVRARGKSRCVARLLKVSNFFSKCNNEVCARGFRAFISMNSITFVGNLPVAIKPRATDLIQGFFC